MNQSAVIQNAMLYGFLLGASLASIISGARLMLPWWHFVPPVMLSLVVLEAWRRQLAGSHLSPRTPPQNIDKTRPDVPGDVLDDA